MGKRATGKLEIANIALVAVVCVAVGSSVAVASHDDAPRPLRPAVKPVLKTHVAEITKLLRRPLLASALASRAANGFPYTPRLEITREISMAKRKRRVIKPFVYAATIDGHYAYTAGTARAITYRSDNEFSLPTRVVRKDLSTGAEQVLLTTSRSLIVSMSANNGRVALSMLRISSGRKSIGIDSQILSAAHTDPTLQTLDSQAARIPLDDHGETFCGTVKLVSGISNTGEMVVLDVTGACKSTPPLTMKTFGLRADGTTRILEDPLELGAIFEPNSRLSGDRLMGTGSDESGIDVLDVSTGKTEHFWTGYETVADQADDGTVAVAELDSYDAYLDEFGPPGVRRRKTPPANPLVVFPQGNSDTPVLGTKATSDLETLRFCGSNLYALRVVSRSRSRYNDGGDVLGLNGSQPNTVYRVNLLNKAGAYVRTIAKTPKMNVAAIGCDAETIELASVKDGKLHVLRYGP